MQTANYALWAVIHMGALALMLLCAAGMGSIFLRRYRFQNLAEQFALTIALGLGLCALVLFILGLFGLFYRPLIWVLTVSGALSTVSNFAYRRWSSLSIHRWKEQLTNHHLRPRFSVRNTVKALLIISALCYWGLLMMTSQYPPIQWDSISHHLIIAREFLLHHRPVVVLGIQQPILLSLNHTLFAWAMALRDDILAQMVEHTFLMLTAVGLYGWGKRQNRPALGFAAAALWCAHPLVRLLGEAAYVDIAVTSYAFLGVYALRIFWDARKVRWWYLGIALLSMAASVKLPGLFFIGIACALGLWVVVQSSFRFPGPKSPKQNTKDGGEAEPRFSWRSLALGWVLALALLCPWYGFVAYHTGNPLWPTFAQYSRGYWAAPWVVSGVRDLLTYGRKEATFKKFLMLSVDWILHPTRFEADNSQGLFPLIMIWPLAWIVALFNRSVRWWTLWALAYTFFWFVQVRQLRYWLLALPLASLALCESLQWILQRIHKSAALHDAAWVALSVVILAWGGRGLAEEVTGKGLPPSTPAAREAFLSQLNCYFGLKYVNEHADKNDTVCVLSASWLNYYFRPRVIDLRGTLFQNRKPSFRWPSDQLWVDWLNYEDVEWIFIYYKAPELTIPKQNPVTNPFWPNYKLVYADHVTWVFRRQSAPLQVVPTKP